MSSNTLVLVRLFIMTWLSSHVFWEVSTTLIPKKSPTLTICLRRGGEAACPQRGQYWLTAAMHYLPAIPTGVLRRAGFPEGVAGRPSISVSIVLCCLLVGCEGMARNNIPDVPRGRNCVTHTHSGVFLSGYPQLLHWAQKWKSAPHTTKSPPVWKRVCCCFGVFHCFAEEHMRLLVSYHLSCGFLLSSKGQSRVAQSSRGASKTRRLIWLGFSGSTCWQNLSIQSHCHLSSAVPGRRGGTFHHWHTLCPGICVLIFSFLECSSSCLQIPN